MEWCVWDGKRIVIPSGATVEAESPIAVHFIDPDRNIQYGKGCQVETIFDENGSKKEFILTTADGQYITTVFPWQVDGTIIGDDEEVTLIQYENNKVYLVFLEVLYHSESTLLGPDNRDGVFHVATYSLNDKKLTTKKYALVETADIYGSLMPTTSTSAIIGHSFYFKDTLDFSSLNFHNGEYSHYKDYSRKAIETVFRNEKFEEIGMYDISFWEDYMLLHCFTLTKLLHGKTEISSLRKEKLLLSL